MKAYSSIDMRKVTFKKRRTAVESGVQQRMVNLWRNCAKAQHRDALFAVPNGGMLTQGYRYRLVREGLIAGWPDMGLCLPDGRIVWFELKRPKTYTYSPKSERMVVADSGGSPGKRQQEVHAMLKALGHTIIVIDNEMAFLAWVKQNAGEMLNG